ncbi:MAG TPA: fibronectin/fibrinogen-binding protein [Papillibacter sp.]|nr:fibronectin/fibrinogen-binding protein [Papillibacter sp.]
MPLDALCLSALARELREALIGAKIDKVQQPERDTILLTVRSRQEGSKRLLLSAGTGDARCHFTEAAFENPASPPMFCMLLRKHLVGARIQEITQPPCERLLDFRLESSDALGDNVEKHLIVEMMGRYSNIILTDGAHYILDCLSRVDMLMSEKRQLLPGLVYRLPPQTKRIPMELTGEELSALLQNAPQDRPADKWLTETMAGISPLVAREIVFLSSGDTDTPVAHFCSQGAREVLTQAFFGVLEKATTGDAAPVMLIDGSGKPRDFTFMPIRQYGGAMEAQGMENFSQLLDRFYTRRAQAERMRLRASTLTKTVKNAHDRIARKLSAQRMELAKTEKRERIRQLGDLLTANFHRIEKGLSSVRVEDFYAEEGGETEIPLDPMKTPQQNAAKYYKEYTKLKNAEIMLTEQIVLGEQELEYLKSVLEALQRAEAESDLVEIREELVQTGYLRPQKSGQKVKRPESAPMRFQSDEGFLITVGRNNMQNERLTHKMAMKSDIWLHAQKIPGSHVIIATGGREVGEETIYQAAVLAATFSQARGGGKVAVDYAPVRNVRKMPGGRPGMVTYTNFKTCIVEPDEALAERLRIK